MASVYPQEDSVYLEPAKDRLNIWFYWENLSADGMPAYLRICQEIVRAKCPDAQIHLVTPDNISGYLPEIDVDLDSIRMTDPNKPAVALRADYLRVKLLHEYGGLWLDCDCVVLKDLSPVIGSLLYTHDFVCMRKISKDERYISNGSIASRPRGAVITQYLDAMEAHIAGKKRKGETFAWAEIGARMLTPIVNAAPEGSVAIIPESDVHPFDFTEAKALEGHNSRIDLDARLGENTLCVMLYHSLFGDFLKKAPRSFVLNSDRLVARILRYALGGAALPQLPIREGFRAGGKRAYSYKDIAIIFTTFARPDSCREFLHSVRAHWGGEINVYFAVQGEPEMRGVYDRMARKYAANVIYVADDAGLSASRNALIDATSEPVVFLCDDDFVVTERTRLDIALDLFNARPDIHILGGMFENFYYNDQNKLLRSEFTAFDHHISDIPQLADQKFFIPSEYLFPEKHFTDHRHYFYFTDTVNNFALMDRAIFNELGIRWDDDIKIMGEHEDFYLKVKALPAEKRVGVAYTNALEIEHHRKSSPAFSESRSRIDGMKRSLANWGLSAYVFLGKRVNRVNKSGEYTFKGFPGWGG